MNRNNAGHFELILSVYHPKEVDNVTESTENEDTRVLFALWNHSKIPSSLFISHFFPFEQRTSFDASKNLRHHHHCRTQAAIADEPS